MIKPRTTLLLLCSVLGLLLTGCLTQRTVTSGGVTTEQKIIVKRPVKTLIDNTSSSY